MIPAKKRKIVWENEGLHYFKPDGKKLEDED
jgi:hypothetical protein